MNAAPKACVHIVPSPPTTTPTRRKIESVTSKTPGLTNVVCIA